jgi:hypothetical protein
MGWSAEEEEEEDYSNNLNGVPLKLLQQPSSTS